MRLARAGVHTAAEVDGRIFGIPGIGPTRGTFLLDWINRLKARAQQGMPTALPAAVRTAITSKYVTRRSNLEVQRSAAQQQYQREQSEAQTRYQAPRAILDCEEEQLSARSKAEVEQIRSHYAQRYHSITQARMKLAEDLKSRVSQTGGLSEEVRRDLFRLHWEREKLGRELMKFQDLSFGNYVERLFWRG